MRRKAQELDLLHMPVPRLRNRGGGLGAVGAVGAGRGAGVGGDVAGSMSSNGIGSVTCKHIGGSGSGSGRGSGRCSVSSIGSCRGIGSIK